MVQWEHGLVSESWIAVKNWGCNTFFGTCDTFLTLLPLSPCPNFVVICCSVQISVSSWSASCTQRDMVYFGERVGGKGARWLIYLSYILVRVYRSSHYLYFHWCVQYETVFDRRVPKIVCRCVISLRAVWSWDLVGQCLHSGVCVSRCVYCMKLVPQRYTAGRASGPDEGT